MNRLTVLGLLTFTLPFNAFAQDCLKRVVYDYCAATMLTTVAKATAEGDEETGEKIYQKWTNLMGKWKDLPVDEALQKKVMLTAIEDFSLEAVSACIGNSEDEFQLLAATAKGFCNTPAIDEEQASKKHETELRPDQIYWSLATRPAGIGYATAIGNSALEARDNAINACNKAKYNGVNLPVVKECISVGLLNMKNERCIAVVNGFVPGTSFSVHSGKSYEDRDPRNAALSAAFQACRDHWGSYGNIACKNYNGGASNETRTTFLFCTSDAVKLYASHLPEPKIVSKFHNDDGSLIKESDYTDQSPLAKEIRRIDSNSSLNAVEKMKRIQNARRRFRNQ